MKKIGSDKPLWPLELPELKTNTRKTPKDTMCSSLSSLASIRILKLFDAVDNYVTMHLLLYFDTPIYDGKLISEFLKMFYLEILCIPKQPFNYNKVSFGILKDGN